MDIIGEEDDDSTITDSTGKSFTTSCKIATKCRRTWPQTMQEVENRYGKTIRGLDFEHGLKIINKTQELMYGWNRLYYEENRPHYNTIRTQVIDWEQPPSEKGLAIQDNSIWNDANASHFENVDCVELARITSLFEPSRSDKRRSNRQHPVASVLGAKRSTTISIAMRRLKLQPPKFSKLADALSRMDEGFLDSSTVELFLKSSIWASDEELQLLKARICEGFELAEPDSLLWFLAVAVPNTNERIRALAVKHEFEVIMNQVIKATSVIKSASLEVISNALLKQLMRVILLVGNRINKGIAASEAVSLAGYLRAQILY
jgi:hypothetical protein